MRRSDRIRRKKRTQPITPIQKKTEKEVIKVTKSTGGWYDKHYKELLIIPFFLLLAALVAIGMHYATTGDFINRGVSLEGGLLVTIPSSTLDAGALVEQLRQEFPNDIESRILEEAGRQVAVTITSDITPEQEATIELFVARISQESGIPQQDLSIETIGSALGATFFQQTLKALFIAFIFMGFVVFLYFGEHMKIKIISGALSILAAAFMYSGSSVLNIIAFVLGIGLIILYTKYSIPSVAVILAAFSDIVITLGVVNLLGIKISTAGIAAFLMLIGYSVDTDILLSTRVLKRTGGSIYDRVINALKTGLTMNITTMTAILVALIFAESEIIIQIMTILLIGLLADMINTWFQNVGILRWHLERKEARSK